MADAKLRFAIGGISHETNTFCAGLTTVDDFKRREWQHGQEVIDGHRGVRDDLGGMIDAADRLGIEVVPTFSATTEPSGTIAADALATMLEELLAGLRAAGTVDAVCLALHGAGVAEGEDDIEGAIIEAVRELIGPDTPLIVTLDLHGNLTERMVQHADALLVCHLYPHTDMYERGVEAVELAARMVRGEAKPAMHITILPMMIPPSTTNVGPAHAINELCYEWESAPGMIDCTFVHGFPHTDVPVMAISVVAIADGDGELARRASRAVAHRIWETRDDFVTPLPSPAEAIEQALNTDGRPVVIAEVSDNSGGGAPADGTHLLRAMLEADLHDACFGFLCDPEVAAQAHAAGTGATIDIRLGAKTDQLHGTPIETSAYVKCLTDGRFILQTPMGRGALVDRGPMARLVIGGVDVIVSTTRSQTLDPEVFLLHGIDVTRYKIVALKSQQHFRAGFEPVAARIIRTDPPGATASNLHSFTFERAPRPIWPLDRDVVYSG
jgi:microcystin degradation protein MlrC